MSFRICARLETKGNQVVKGYQLEGLRVVGELSELANTYYTAGVDELIVSDVTSSWFSTQTTVSMLSKLIEGCFVPITIGGGIRTLDDVDSCLRAGAERVSINTASFKSPDLLVQIARKYGSQSIVVNLQAKKINGDYYCYFFNGRENTNLTLESFLSTLSCNVAGEILINSIDNDGAQNGPDFELVNRTLKNTELPVIYAGGVGRIQQIRSLFDLSVNAVAIGAALHYKKLDIAEIKSSPLLDGFGMRR